MIATIDITAARAQLGRTSIVLPDPVPAHPLLDGKEEIGRGEYSIVLDKGDGERVYKIVSSPADYFLYTADDRPRGEHFPVIHADHGIIGRAQSGYPLHLIEMEKLYPLADGSPAAALALRLIDTYWSACQQWGKLGADMGRIALYDMTLNPFASDKLDRALKALSDFVEEYQVLPDILNANNLMMRKDGTLCFAHTTQFANLTFDFAEGHVTLLLDELRLLSGEFTIPVWLFDENGVHRFHERPATDNLIVQNRTKDLGLFLQAHRWHVEPKRP